MFKQVLGCIDDEFILSSAKSFYGEGRDEGLKVFYSTFYNNYIMTSGDIHPVLCFQEDTISGTPTSADVQFSRGTYNNDYIYESKNYVVFHSYIYGNKYDKNDTKYIIRPKQNLSDDIREPYYWEDISGNVQGDGWWGLYKSGIGDHTYYAVPSGVYNGKYPSGRSTGIAYMRYLNEGREIYQWTECGGSTSPWGSYVNGDGQTKYLGYRLFKSSSTNPDLNNKYVIQYGTVDDNFKRVYKFEGEGLFIRFDPTPDKWVYGKRVSTVSSWSEFNEEPNITGSVQATGYRVSGGEIVHDTNYDFTLTFKRFIGPVEDDYTVYDLFDNTISTMYSGDISRWH